MGSDRLRKIEELYHLAKALTPEQRKELLAQSDPELQHEVQSLLAHENGENPLDRPAMEVAANLLKDSSIAGLTVGEQLGPYQIEGLLGTGGKGHVYKARDTRLSRTVAIKVLSQEFSNRFERETRAISSLNHPNICTLHDVGPNYLVMELVEGLTLAERIKAGALPLREALGIARQIADALEAAHERGVVHRDMKPGNIKIKPDGTVKVLDFGLATITMEAAASESEATHTRTAPGVVVGTAAYMSPEQAAGKPVDKRGDIWSFGLILWELLTGRRLFHGDTVSQTIADVINAPIDLDERAPEIPTAIRNVLHRCLDRNTKTRLRDIGEARITLDVVLSDKSPPLVDSPPKTNWVRAPLTWIVAALTIGLVTIALLTFGDKRRVPASPVRVQIPLPENTTPGPLMSLSPDGRKLAFWSTGRLWVYSLETGESRDLAIATGTPFGPPMVVLSDIQIRASFKRSHRTAVRHRP